MNQKQFPFTQWNSETNNKITHTGLYLNQFLTDGSDNWERSNHGVIWLDTENLLPTISSDDWLFLILLDWKGN